MPAKASDRQLSDTLSARSYLQPRQAAYCDRIQDPNQASNDGYRTSERSTDPEPRLNLDTAQQRSRKRGRPRLDPSDIAPFEVRRSQVRRAQRTYRSKKEAAIQSLRSRVTDLEGSLRTISDILTNFQHTVASSDLNLSSSSLPLLSSDAIDRVLAEVEKSGLSSDRRITRPASFPTQCVVGHEPSVKPGNYLKRGLLDVFGYQVSHQPGETCQIEDEADYQQRQPELLTPQSLPGHSDLRQLIEHAHQSDQKSVFCLLGHLDQLGGDAASHFQIDDLRGTLQRAMESMLGLEDAEGLPEYSQQWVHCHDVRAYLEQMGIMLDRSSLLVDVPIQSAIALQGEDVPRPGFESKTDESPRGVDSADLDGLHADDPDLNHTKEGPSDYFLDVESFFNLLRANIKFRSRAPGFRRADINAALRSAIRKRL